MDVSPQTTVVGFIGLGVMGRSMAGHLLEAGYRVVCHNRTRSKAGDLLDRGAVWKESPAEVAKKSDVVITMLGYPADVEEVYRGADGLMAHASGGSVLVDMTTSSPRLATELAHEGQLRGLGVLDAPVSGGDIGAREARLSIMVGGEREVFEQVRPLFELMGRTIMHQGAAGAGQHTKLANQISVAGTMIGAVEALVYAKKAGLDPARVLESIGGGAAASWSLNQLGPRMIREDWAPGFYVKHFLKDLGLVLEATGEVGCALPGVEVVRRLYAAVVEAGDGDQGTQALMRWYLEGGAGGRLEDAGGKEKGG